MFSIIFVFQTSQHFNQRKFLVGNCWALFELFELYADSCLGTVSNSFSLFYRQTELLLSLPGQKINKTCPRYSKSSKITWKICTWIFYNVLCLWKVCIKGELQREKKLISYERAFKMLEKDMYIAGIGQAVLELLSFKVESGNHQRGISLLQTFSDILGNMRLVPLKMTSHLTSHNFQILKIEIFSKLCKI